MLVVRDLVLGPKRFTDLLAGLPGASADVLTQRLRELTEAGVVHRRRLSPPAASWVYELTPWGAELAPVLLGLAQWASRSPTMRYDAPLGTDSLMLSLKALFDGPAAADLDATIAVHLGDERFQLHIADGELTVTRGEIDEPNATIDTDQTTLLSLLRSERPLDDILASGNLRLAGDAGSWRGSGAYFRSRSRSRSPTAPKTHPVVLRAIRAASSRFRASHRPTSTTTEFETGPACEGRSSSCNAVSQERSAVQARHLSGLVWKTLLQELPHPTLDRDRRRQLR